LKILSLPKTFPTQRGSDNRSESVRPDFEKRHGSEVNAAINVKGAARYDADVAKTLAGRLAGGTCFCPAEFGPCCIGGVCRADIQCSMSGP